MAEAPVVDRKVVEAAQETGRSRPDATPAKPVDSKAVDLAAKLAEMTDPDAALGLLVASSKIKYLMFQ